MKNFFSKIKSFYTGEDTKVKAIIITAGAVAAIAIIITIIVILNSGGSKAENEKKAESGSGTATVAEKDVKKADDTKKEETKEVTPLATPEPEEPSLTPEPTLEPEPTEEPPVPTEIDYVELHKEKGEVQSDINGNWVDEAVAKQRPYCIMFNNIYNANPQSGIGEADILYEILVEGGITRCMGVFENLTDESKCKDRIGSVRSARHYYASIASEYDAIFIHYGETTYATKKIAALGLDHLEGLYSEGSTVYYRDKTIKAPHNAFATLSGIHKAIADKKYRTEHKDDFVPQHFRFAIPEGGYTSIDSELIKYLSQKEQASSGSGEEITGSGSGEGIADSGSGEEISQTDSLVHITEQELSDFDTEVEGVTKAAYISLPFSSFKPYLKYDSTTKLYTRYQFGGVHIDYNTKEPLTFKNIIIQLVQESNRDKNGYQDIEGYSDRSGHAEKVSGKGYYICEGRCIEITWQKNEKEFTCNYYSPEGDILVLRPGKTFIAVYPESRKNLLEIKESV